MMVLPIKPEETHPWILQKHYAKRLPNIMFAFGLYEKNKLIGVVTYGMPASRSLCVGICGEQYSDFVIELNRLCLQNNDKNEASFLVGNSLKLLPRPKIVVSYADAGQGHIGYVYQATNFLFTGTTKERTDMFAGNGKHSRHAKESSVRQHRSAKHRYVYFVGTKTDKKLLQKQLNYEIQPYPKGETKQYNAGNEVITQQILFL